MRKDLRDGFRTGARNVETALAGVDSAQLQVNLWEELVDVYNDKTFWRHRVTGQITLDQPGLEHYLPPNFRVPTPPRPLPEGVSALSSESEEDDPSSLPFLHSNSTNPLI